MLPSRAHLLLPRLWRSTAPEWGSSIPIRSSSGDVDGGAPSNSCAVHDGVGRAFRNTHGSAASCAGLWEDRALGSSAHSCSFFHFGVPGSSRYLHSSHAAADAVQQATLDRLDRLSAAVEAAEGRIALLEAKEGMQDTVHQYAQFLDKARHDPAKLITNEAVAKLFTASAKIDLKERGVVEDLDSIQPFLQRFASMLLYSKSHVADLAVEVDKERPRSGRARFYMLTAATLAHDKQDVWAMETVVMEMRAGFDGRWRIQTMEYEPGAVSTPFAGTGWSLAPNVIKERLESEQSQ
mmetsp:Transcript_20457/g.57061  ORF Transcript_20457/g.57061 Transcript_20457/m.57061 type:complete len:294 (-) Transcript_20457:353-1234(-)|eukprot:CAMPEP_0202351002 /NCGR_PEP_ID=MMETSP1126-20121109/7835_1 /ASSEMBLY_ACC=CAM_ASM_000457 /TAXON_ID=3047 /ORGANISM="Dunaliella tertiolecta, Strain CCMP1320" /LENGTH=293 /DNA_ID=CAMNT_0048943059 /DNA_START=789 /DNA_END=1670 /DNA_ORIENTATION=-